MKRMIIFLALLIVLFTLVNVSAENCDLDISLINQDPYPAIPGDYVKIVFQVDGVSNPECGTISFELLEQYPLIFDPGTNPIITIDSGVYHKDYNSFLIAPYKVRIDEDALDGETPIEIQYKLRSNQVQISEEFNLNIQDTRADFEVYVKDYNPSTKEITFEILNIADADVEALTIKIPKQDNIKVKGPNTNIIGDLDSNDYTTANFEAQAKEGEITLEIYYIDAINERRSLEKKVLFEPEYFEDRANGKKGLSFWFYLFWIGIIFLIAKYYYKKKKAKTELHKKRR